ncbi:MAG: rhamnulose-1-phosphate aldolase, partial [Acholeplasmataceae bacterium]
VGIIKILESGKEAEVVWGFITGGKPTSELSTHLYCHIERLLNNANHKVIIHTHATHINEMSILPNLDEKSFTRSLWEINSENIIVFPKGIGIIPWLVPGNSDIGTKTAKKMQEFDIVVWPLHGVVAAGDNLDHTFGVLETINKSAKTYMKVKDIPNRNVITKEQLIKLTNYFKVDYRKEFLD